jgi:hypothetical protein
MASSPRRGTRVSIVAAALVYGLVTFAGLFLDHDFACHQNSRTHCPFCQIIHSDQKAELGRIHIENPRRLSYKVESLSDVAGDTPALSSVSDRAPPA